MCSKHAIVVLLHIAWKLVFTRSSSSCFSSLGKVNYCEPDFIRIVQGVTVESTSTCGQRQSTEKICLDWYSPSGPDRADCLKCDERIPELSRNASFVLDRHVRDHETIWMSNAIPQTGGIHTVNITISLKKLYETYYVAIEFGGPIPDSLILYKSNDNQKSWVPWNYFSSSCQKTFRMRRSKPNQIRQSNVDKVEPVCFSFLKTVQNITNNYKVVPFNPMLGRTGVSFDLKLLKDWVSLTDLKVSLLVDTTRKRKGATLKHLAISDITIGGRGQCYGHANSLITVNNTIMCSCAHGTSGPDCSYCLKTHNDQPWRMMSNDGINEKFCERCFCNNHAEECEFDKQVYENTSRKHGSRCLNCLHNTTGAHCDSCASGYYRNRKYPVNHPLVCQKCSCHPIGSLIQSQCDPGNGNCHCKKGVEGRACNRCKKGYIQTKSSETPCASDSKKDMIATEERCGTCGKNRPRIKFRKFCKKHIMIKISVQSKEIHGVWTRFGVRVLKIWRIQQSLRSQVNLHESEFLIYPIWVENADIRCNCPSFQLGQTYLLLTKVKQKLYLNQPELIVDKKSIALDWRDNWTRRLNKFKERETQGKCHKFQYRQKQSRWQRSFHTKFSSNS